MPPSRSNERRGAACPLSIQGPGIQSGPVYADFAGLSPPLQILSHRLQRNEHDGLHNEEPFPVRPVATHHDRRNDAPVTSSKN